MSFPSESDLKTHGFLPALPRNLSLLFSNPSPPTPVPLPAIPTTPLATTITTYARSVLPPPTFNHSMRVYLFGLIIAQQYLPHLTFTPESFYLLSLFHDIGTVLPSALSFEYSGGIHAREKILSLGGAEVLADSVAEGVIRHQDVFLGVEGGDGGGKVSALTGVVHLSTLLDNVGKNVELVHEDVIKAVVEAWPREGWSGCFVDVVKKEGERKPWCHTTTIGVGKFVEDVEGNELMNAFEK